MVVVLVTTVSVMLVVVRVVCDLERMEENLTKGFFQASWWLNNTG